jgi:hypothetical protein
MNKNSFVPLSLARADLPSVPAGPGFKPAPEATARAAFHPLAQASEPSAPAAAHPPGEPKIALERDGERVTRILIECTCGRTLELDCSY